MTSRPPGSLSPDWYGHIPPLREFDVEEMGLTLGPVCDVQHRPGMKTHRHIDLPKSTEGAIPLVTHECPLCGDVHLPRAATRAAEDAGERP